MPQRPIAGQAGVSYVQPRVPPGSGPGPGLLIPDRGSAPRGFEASALSRHDVHGVIGIEKAPSRKRHGSPILRERRIVSLAVIIPNMSTSAGDPHLLYEALWAYESNCANAAQFIEVLNFPKLAGRDVRGIVGFFDHGLKELRFKSLQRIWLQATILDLI
jgi:hypothetical protein